MRFIDLFCGAGFATHGLMQAGLTPIVGVDNAPAALSAYRVNSRGREMEGDIGNLSAAATARLVSSRPDLVWMSPPDELRAPVRRGRWSADDQVDVLTMRAATLAARCAPSYIVLEGRLGALQLEARRAIDGVLRAYGRPEVYTLDDRLHAGSAQPRWHTYLIWARRERAMPVIELSSCPGCAADVIDRTLPVSESMRSMSARRVAAVTRLNQLGGGVLVYRRGARGDADTVDISRLDEPHPVLTARTQCLYAYGGGWRAPTAGEYRRLLGVAADFQLAARGPERHRQASHATDARVSAMIGRSLMSSAGHWRGATM